VAATGFRVGVGYLLQESNTFSPLATRLDDFGLSTGAAAGRWRGTGTEMGGFLDALGERAVPLFAGWAITKGRIAAGELRRMVEMVAEQVRAAGPLDGLALALHGAMCAEGEDDAEGAILAAVREVVGPQLRIVLTLDLHANLTRRMVSLADAVVGYRTYPHVDMRQVAVTAAELLRPGIAPRTVMRKIPMILPAENMQTADGPMAEVWRYAAARASGLLSYSVFGVQPWLDIEEMGCSVAAVADGDTDAAQAFCDDVARHFWKLRGEFAVKLAPPAEAIRQALAVKGQPVVLAESSDSPTAGAPGDSAAMLRAILEHAPNVPAALWLCDPPAVEAAARAGTGARLGLSLGGTYNGSRVPVKVEVLSLSDGEFTMRGSQYTGTVMRMGRTAVLKAGAVRIVVSEKPANNIDPELFRSQGIEPRELKLVVVKSATAFRAEYGPFAAAMLVVDTPGVSSANLGSFEWKRVPRPIHPLDPMEKPF